MKIIHQRDKCIGCGSCVMYAPNRWKMNGKDGQADLLGGIQKGNMVVAKIDFDEVEQNKKAERACPMQIIKVEE